MTLKKLKGNPASIYTHRGFLLRLVSPKIYKGSPAPKPR